MRENAWADEASARPRLSRSGSRRRSGLHRPRRRERVLVSRAASGTSWRWRRGDSGDPPPRPRARRSAGLDPPADPSPSTSPHLAKSSSRRERWLPVTSSLAPADLVLSLDGRLVAWARDLAGDERHQWIIREVATGRTIDEEVADAGYGFAWAADPRPSLRRRRRGAALLRDLAPPARRPRTRTASSSSRTTSASRCSILTRRTSAS